MPNPAVSATSAAPPRSRLRGLLTGLLRVALGLFVLFLVARTLPWRDQLVFHEGVPETEHSHALSGEIDGDWTGEHVRFTLDAGQTPGPAWPELVRSAARDGTPIEVERMARPNAELGGAFDWRPSMPRAFREIDTRGLGVAALLFLCAMSCAVTRWWRLLAVIGCRTSWFNAWRLTFLGMFFNLVVPGLTGGDLIKGVIVAHENPKRRGEAVVSVVIDRLIGIVALAALALAVILVAGDSFAELRLPVVAFLGAAVLGALCYVNGSLRRLVRFDALLAKLPFGEKLRSLDEAVMTYRRRPRELGLAVAISLANHTLTIAGFIALGAAFSVSDVSAADYFVMVPIGNIVSALPLAPGGWGLGEYVFRELFEMIGADGNLGVAVSVTFRLIQLAFGLVGGVFLMMPGARKELHESEAEAAALEAPLV